MNSRVTSMLVRGILAALMISAVFVGSAGAAPSWKFEGKALEGSETAVGGAEDSYMTVPGLTTDCENFLYDLTISNSGGGTGEGELVELPLYECATDTDACTVDAIKVEGLPWESHLTTVSTKNYIVIEGILVEILYGG
jgi:hypothetical protein